MGGYYPHILALTVFTCVIALAMVREDAVLLIRVKKLFTLIFASNACSALGEAAGADKGRPWARTARLGTARARPGGDPRTKNYER